MMDAKSVNPVKSDVQYDIEEIISLLKTAQGSPNQSDEWLMTYLETAEHIIKHRKKMMKKSK